MLAGPNPKKKKLNEMSNNVVPIDPNEIASKFQDRLRDLEA